MSDRGLEGLIKKTAIGTIDGQEGPETGSLSKVYHTMRFLPPYHNNIFLFS